MRRSLPLLLCLLLIFGCSGASRANYQNDMFSASLPEPFEPVDTASVVCFAPHGDPLLSSSITFYTTESNWYFDSFSLDEYADALQTLCEYESMTVEQIDKCHIDGYDAYRISCKVFIDRATHDLILYTVNADRTYIFTLLNRDGDTYIQAFDSMMSTLHLTEE